MLAAINNNGEALQYASKKLKGDEEEIILAAIKNKPDTLQYASK